MTLKKKKINRDFRPSLHRIIEELLVRDWQKNHFKGELRMLKLFNLKKKGVVLAYDITNRETFEKLSLWKSEIDTYAKNERLQTLILGNKSDLESIRAVPTLEAQEFAKHIGANFIEVSAKAKTNVEEAFQMLTEACVNANASAQTKPLPEEKVNLSSSKKKKGVCVLL